jgi:hypothetical protein
MDDELRIQLLSFGHDPSSGGTYTIGPVDRSSSYLRTPARAQDIQYEPILPCVGAGVQR